ncbi:hypothetical protein DBR42_05290, partial [Pelomonas sp. HMWF004]
PEPEPEPEPEPVHVRIPDRPSPEHAFNPREQAQQAFDTLAVELCRLWPLELPQARSLLERCLRAPGLISLEAGEHFRHLIQQAICDRRLGRHTALLLFAAIEVLHWRDPHTLVDAGSLASQRLQGMLDIVLILSHEHQHLWRWLALEPNGNLLSYMPLVNESFDWDSPLHTLCCEAGELAKWRGLIAFGSVHRPLDTPTPQPPKPGFWRRLWGHRDFLFLPAVLLFLFVVVAPWMSQVGKEQRTKALADCNAQIANAVMGGWRQIVASQIGPLEQCAIESPPPRCEDREHLRALSTLARVLDGRETTALELGPYRSQQVMFNPPSGLLFEVGGSCEERANATLDSAWWLKLDHLPSARKLVGQLARCAAEGKLSNRGDWRGEPWALRLLALTDAWHDALPASERSAQEPVVKLESLLTRSALLQTPQPLKGEQNWPACQ